MNLSARRADSPSLLRTTASIAWTALVVSALAVLLLRDPHWLRDAMQLFGPVDVFASAFFVLVAKILLAELFGVVARSEGVPLSLYERQRTYHLAQLAKYLPGLVWQFASKGYLLKRSGARPATAARVVAIEQFWIIGGAGVVGIGVAVISVQVVAADFGFQIGHLGEVAAALLALSLGIAAVCAIRFRRRGRGTARRSLAGLSLTAWLALSLSFAILSARASSSALSGLLVGGAAFPIAFVGGYIAPFAPGGIGVREGLLAVLLGPILRPEIALVVALTSRLVYVVVEVLLFIGLAKQRKGSLRSGRFA